MKTNFNTFKVESWLGAVFVLLLAGFFLGLFFIFMKNFDSDLATANTTAASYGSPQERSAMNEWAKKNNIDAPPGPNRVRYLISRYPDRPWLTN